MEPADIETAWAEVEARWGVEEAHRAFLDRFSDLEGLAEAGRRYKLALDARPGDAVALRFRDEVVKRATALALAQLPRTRPLRQASPGVRRLVLGAAFILTLAAVGWSALHLVRLAGAAR
jgi:hypothetical protein